ncbi:MAG: TRAP transporter substrate-binding protein [Alphaproteobacteria bacterium]|nr:TRAP transporter substrate-binding protein [Alphaproteobacteria bacterium]
MTDRKDDDTRLLRPMQEEDRRGFMRTVAKFGFTTAVVAAGAGTLAKPAAAQTRAEEQERQTAATHTMTIGTAYKIGTTRSYPIMQLNLKENIQNLTNGQVYVKLAPGGALGVGTKLVEKVQANTIQAAQHSLSNFAPFAPAVDLINLPYWCGENQRFVNLVTSGVWEQEVNSRVKAKGFKPLFYFCIDPRTAAKRRGLSDEPFRTPADLQGIKFRVPGSKILQQFYRLLGANPTPVAWGETPSAIKQGVADALDPAVEALYAFGFKDILSWVTFNRSVPDSQVYSCNLEWFNGLPKDVREGIDFASEVTFQQNLAQVPASRAFAMAEMAAAGVKFHALTKDEYAAWVETAGQQRKEWNEWKVQLGGSIATFDRLLEAANTKSKYNVHDV